MPNEPGTNSGKQIDSAQQKQSGSIPPRLLYAIAIAGLVVLACLPLTLALVSYFRINTHSVRTIFFVNSLINLLIFIAIVIQAGIYWKQRALMEQQSKAMQDGLTETRNLVAQNERVVQAAETTAALTEKSFHMNSRAYVFIGTAGLEFPISSGQYPLPKIVLRNSGKSPAFRYRTRVEQAFLAGTALEKAKKGIMPEIRPLSKRGSGTIGAGQTAAVHLDPEAWASQEDEELALKNESTYYIWGRIGYSDIFGQEHSSRFSLYARNPNITSLSWGMFGNVAEDEEDAE